MKKQANTLAAYKGKLLIDEKVIAFSSTHVWMNKYIALLEEYNELLLKIRNSRELYQEK